MTTPDQTDEQTEDPMAPMALDHFTIAVLNMRLSDENLINACREVLVDEVKNNEVEEKYGVRQNHLSATCKNIIRKWEEICLKEGLECRPVALPPQVMKMVLGFEEYVLRPIMNLKKKNKRKE